MKRLLLVGGILAASIPQAGMACRSVLALRLNECDESLAPKDSCNVGLLRFDPWVSKYLVEKEHFPTDSPLLDYIPLRPEEENAAQNVAKYMLKQERSVAATKALNSAMWYEAYDKPISFTSAAPFATQAVPRLQRAAVIERDCNSFSVKSLTNKSDSTEHFALIIFQCQVDGTKTAMLAGVALRNAVPVRVYNGVVAPVCLPEPKPERG